MRRLSSLIGSPALRLAFLILALLFMAFVVRGRWQELKDYHFHIRPLTLVASVFLLLSALGLEVALWRLVLLGLGYSLSFRRAASIWFLSNLVRYIPGNVWQFLGMIELGMSSGVPRRVSLASIAVHQVFSNLSGLCAGTYAVSRAGLRGFEVLPAIVVISFMVVVLVGRRLPVLIMQRLTALAGTDLQRVHFSASTMTLLLTGYCAYWAISGTAFWLLAVALGAPPASPLAWASAFAAAYVVGYLSLLTPSGLGVREASLTLLLDSISVAGPVAIAALVARLWFTLCELVAAAIAVASDRDILLRSKTG